MNTPMPTFQQEFPTPINSFVNAELPAFQQESPTPINPPTNIPMPALPIPAAAPPVDKMHRLVQQVGNRYLLSRVCFGIYWNNGSPSFEEFYFSPLFVGHNDITMLEAAEAAVAQFFSDSGDTNFKHCMVIGAPHTLYFTEQQLQKESVKSHALEVVTTS